MKRLLLICGIAALCSAPAAMAGKVTVSIVEPAPYVYGQSISVATNDQLDSTGGFWVSIFCYQTDPLTGQRVSVYGFNQRYVALAPSYGPYTLSGTGWTGGAADCSIRVWHVSPGLKHQVTDATLDFHVGA